MSGDQHQALVAERERCAEYAAEAARLRKLFDDAGQGEHNVLALVDHYQRASMEADERLRAVRELLEEHGCDCPCDHHADEHGPGCEVCLACRIDDVLCGGARSPGVDRLLATLRAGRMPGSET